MQVKDHRLILSGGRKAEFKPTPNISSGVTIKPRYLVMHYTAGASLDSSVNWLRDPRAKASAHLVVGRGGEIVQLCAFNQRAWHAGRSNWRGLSGLNGHSIGIEFDNAGPLTETADGWTSHFGRAYPDSEVIEARHKHETEPRGWHRYTEPQLQAASELTACLVDHYGLEDVLGHEDIAPDRKRDPGPAFPLEALRQRVAGRETDEPEIVRTATRLNIRSGPGVGFDKLEDSPLPADTPLTVLAEDGVWLSVEVSGPDGPTATGWVHGGYVR
jgi:N-acetylmuramoyl-L-alanine amidase